MSSTHAFHTQTSAMSRRLQEVLLSGTTIERFHHDTQHWDVQALEYKPFLRFAIADTLDQLCQQQLGTLLRSIIHNRDQGAFLLDYEHVIDLSPLERDNLHIKLSTAISHLLGLPNFDSMAGKYYARFTVKNTDASDSYLRQAHHRLELHNDGTYVDERTDFVLMMKMNEANMQGGDSTLLHLDDWQDLEKFYSHPIAKQDFPWGSPPSKQIDYKVSHSVFFEEDENQQPHMLFIDQFAEPQTMAQGLYLHQMSESLESDKNILFLPIPVGAMLVIHNHRWLHGRDKFVAHPELSRELLRQRGHFAEHSYL